MTKDEAEALANKRNAHKGKSLSNKEWVASEENGQWTVKLVDSKSFVVEQAQIEARNAIQDGRAAMLAGDVGAFLDAASRHLVSRVKIDLNRE